MCYSFNGVQGHLLLRKSNADIFSDQLLPNLTAYYKSRLPADESISASFMSEVLKLRDHYLDFSGAFRLDQSGIATLINFVATA